MAGIKWLGSLTIVGIAFFTGCGRSTSPNAATTIAANGGQPATQANASPNPIGQAASDWLDAVLKGDKSRATARLTPQARQQISKNRMEFSPPGEAQTAGIQIGEVRTPSQDQAIVQCVLSYNYNGKPESEEMCCLMRFVENDWRVAGVAYGTALDKPWILTNFETGQDIPIPRQEMSGGGATTAAASGAAERPSPRTAQETAAANPIAERR